MTYNLGFNGIIQTGIFAGIVTGNPLLGLGVGGILQSYALGIGTYGGTSVPNWQAAAIIVTALAGSTDNVASTIAIIGIPVAALTIQLDVIGRFANTFFQNWADKHAAKGDGVKVHFINQLGLSTFLISRMAPVFIGLLLGPALIDTVREYMPEWLSMGFTIVSKIFPAVGFSILLRYLPTKNYIQYLIIGFSLAAWFNAPILAVSVIGLAAAIIVYKQEGTAVTAGASNMNTGDDYDE
jgi:PTS system mannose-specific IIC component